MALTISRSEIVTIDECEEKAFATYREDGTGYTPSGTEHNIPAIQGIALHAAAACIMDHGPDSAWRDCVDRELDRLPEPHRTIRSTLIRRALLGWIDARYPEIIREWKPLGAELPFEWELAAGIRQPLRLDNIIEHRSTGSIAPFDFKTAGGPDLNWTERKRISKQTHLYVKALKELAPDRHVLGMMYDCIEIGKWDDKKEIHKSPFVTGYRKNSKVNPKWSYGSAVEDLTKYSDDAWHRWAKETNALEGLFWTTGVLTVDDAQLERTKSATIRRVEDWKLKLHEIQNAPNPRLKANEILSRNPDACLQFGWGHVCPFYNRCWKGFAIDEETFERRVDHHRTDTVG